MTRIPSIISENLRKTFLIHYALSVFLPVLIALFVVNQYVYPYIAPDQMEYLRKVFVFGLTAMITIPLLSFFLMFNWVKLFESLTDDVKSKSIEVISEDSPLDQKSEIETLEYIFDHFQRELKTKITELDNYSKQLAESNKKLAELSIQDELTRLYNRRHLDSRLAEEIQRAKRYNCRLSVMMIDIDDFKVYNDTFGHPAGDQLLQEFARIIRDSIRITDIPFRYGGDEFMILSPECDLESTKNVAQRLVDLVGAHPFRFDDRPDSKTITISCGVALFTENQKELLAEVDKCLYRAKDAGGGCVAVS